MSERSSGSGVLHETAQRFSRAQEIRAIGALEGADHEVFGKVEDIAVDGEERMFVLDSRYNNVRMHRGGGDFVRAFGGPGRGPDELMSPEALQRDRRGRLIVADRHNRLKVFAPEDSSFVNVRTIPVEFVPEDFCLLDDAIFVQGARTDGGVIHVFSETGEAVRSFGEAYRSRNWLVRNQLSDGPIACSEEAKTVVTMFKYLPVIYGYSPEGNLKWTSRLADFRPMNIVEKVGQRGEPVVSYRPLDHDFDFAVSLEAMPGGYVIVQTGRQTAESVEDRREYAELRTYLVSAQTGEGVYVGNHLPRVGAVTNRHLFTAVGEPFPQIRIYDLPTEEEGR